MGKAFLLGLLMLVATLPVASAEEVCINQTAVTFRQCVGADDAPASAWRCNASHCTGATAPDGDTLIVYDGAHFWRVDGNGRVSIIGNWDFNPENGGAGERTSDVTVDPAATTAHVHSNGDQILGVSSPLNARLDASSGGASADLYTCFLASINGILVGLDCGDLADGQVRPRPSQDVGPVISQVIAEANDLVNDIRRICPSPPRCFTPV